VSSYKTLDGAKLTVLKIRAEQASSDWPGKQEDIAQRMAIFEALKQTADASYNAMVEENKKPDESVDFDVLLGHAEALNKAKDSFDQSIESIKSLLDQLYESWDKVLVDMEIREGYEVDFFHNYEILKVDGDNNHTTEKTTQRVSKDFYLRHENDLGMVLESKPKGHYDFEADKQTSPPGYSYVGNPHYGKWEKDSRTGSSFWVFYGQYAFMRNLFWGAGYYRPVSRYDWDGYQQARTTGRTYYGRDASGQAIYGSKGTVGKTKYAGSKYSTSGGYTKTQFKKSGGKYRGSKYASTRSRSYSGTSSRSFSSRSRGSRSSGGK
jgi:hypothetical protein